MIQRSPHHHRRPRRWHRVRWLVATVAVLSSTGCLAVAEALLDEALGPHQTRGGSPIPDARPPYRAGSTAPAAPSSVHLRGPVPGWEYGSSPSTPYRPLPPPAPTGLFAGACPGRSLMSARDAGVPQTGASPALLSPRPLALTSGVVLGPGEVEFAVAGTPFFARLETWPGLSERTACASRAGAFLTFGQARRHSVHR